MKQDIATSREAEIRPPQDGDLKHVLAILDKHNQDGHGLIAVLEGIQREYGYLPEKALRTVGERTGRSLVDIYGVATFYRSFSLQPRGKHLISACLGTACHVRGAARIVEEFERQLRIKAGETTPDKQFTLETVNCLGACALGPIVVIDGHYFSNVDTAGVKRILNKARAGLPQVEELAAETSDH
jgi:NADH:ubiquinone oxidoreductase subunit E